jgi:hypothetical protein
VARLTALVGERMQQAGSGSIINVSSIAAIRPDRSVLPYAAALAPQQLLRSSRLGSAITPYAELIAGRIRRHLRPARTRRYGVYRRVRCQH